MAIVRLADEKELLEKVAQGDQRSFNQLFDAYFNVLGAYVLNIVKSIEITEEIVQDVFVKVWLQRSSLTEITNFNNYIFILCRNQTVDQLRKRAKERVLNIELQSFLNQASEHEQLENPSEAYRKLIEDAIDKLPAQARKVYIMSRHDRLKYDEIAKKLDISPETVKKHIQNATYLIKKDVSTQMDAVILLVLLSSLLAQ